MTMNEVSPGFVFTAEGNKNSVFMNDKQFLMLKHHPSFKVVPGRDWDEDEGVLDDKATWHYYTDGIQIYGMNTEHASSVPVKGVREFSGSFGNVDWLV